jgi:hypothetical protein
VGTQIGVTGEPSLPAIPDEDPTFDLERVEPLLFGTIPPLGLVSAGGLSMLAGIALLAAGHWVGGSLLLVLGLVALALYLVAVHGRPRPRIVQRAVGRVWRLRDTLRFAGSSAGAWLHAGYRVLALRRTLRAIARERDRVQYELGAAAYGEDAQRVAELRQRMRELDERMAACARRMDAARRVARARVSKARVPLRTTEIIRPDR